MGRPARTFAVAAVAAVAALASVGGGCDPGLSHRCTAATQCVRGGEQGVCQPTGRCSFADQSCASGQRYSEWAGELESQCVMGGEPDGSGPDGAGADGSPPDAPRLDAAPPDAAPPDAPVDAESADALGDAPP